MERVRLRLPKNPAQATFKDEMERAIYLGELASLSPVEYDRRRGEAATKLGIRKTALDKAVAELRLDIEEAEKQQPAFLQPIEPWPEPVDGVALMDELVAAFNSYSVLPEHADTAAALWVVHAHAHDAATISPILCMSSPVRRCGKTTVLDICQRLTPRAIRAENLTPHTVYRAIALWHPTLLIDEADTFIRPNDELRGVLDSGHLKNGYVLRCVGDDNTPHPFSTWAPKAIGIIGSLPPTLADRSITIPMQRKLVADKIKKLRADTNPFVDLRRKLVRWVIDHMEELRKARPTTLKSLHDRARDNWRPLFAIADTIGGKWSKEARNAAKSLEAVVEEENYPIMLLEDIALWFRRHRHAKGVPTDQLLEWLHAREERPWPGYGRTDKPISAHAVARLLKPFGIKPEKITLEETQTRGYMKSSFDQAFKRYIPTHALSPRQTA